MYGKQKEIRMSMKILAVIGCVLCFLIAAPAWGNEPMTPKETLKESVDQLIEILNDPAGADPAHRVTQRTQLWKIASPMFDFPEISRRAVGPKWAEFTEAEKERFITVFTEFLSNTYIDRLQGEYQNEQIVYVQELVRKPQAIVRTKLVRETAEMPIDYRMRMVGNEWKIYDILVEDGLSIVQNYRVQFQSILQKERPADLINRLENRLKN
jgi:phospholipid transport system substrate-binding protein